MNPKDTVRSLPAPKSDFIGLEGKVHLATGGEPPLLQAHRQAFERLGAAASSRSEPPVSLDGSAAGARPDSGAPAPSRNSSKSRVVSASG